MSTVSRTVHAERERVWQVLADGWSYPVFVVGAARMRAVDPGWPEVGTRIHHSVGVWPGLIDDYTEVMEVDMGQRLVLRARAWPVGEARVEFRLRPAGTNTEVHITEVITAGPGRLVPPPLKGVSLAWRNTETLRRLAYLAEVRA
jgi:hypothetical protein